MCETFKWIKLLAVVSQKDGLQNPIKIFAIRHQISIYGLDMFFSMRHMSLPIIS